MISFFKDIAAFSDPVEMADPKNYNKAPESWCLVMTDVRGSTKAISEGRYKEVNIVGVSSIIAATNALADLEFPYVFGGDGATFLIPEDRILVVKQAMSHTRMMAKAQFGLDLRVCFIPLKDIYDAKAEVLVGKLKISEINSIAVMKGSGIPLGESWMKKTDKYLLASEHESIGELKGLECRWDPVLASKGVMLTVIVQTKEDIANSAIVYSDLIKKIRSIAPESQPVKLVSLKGSWPPKALASEMKMKHKSFFLRLASNTGVLILTKLFSILINKYRIDPTSKISKYISEVGQNTDYIKFDDTLRMVIDVSPTQADQIKELLMQFRHDGKIFYGLHSSNEALMTCFIQSISDHIHFIDGGDGGYAMAAKELKEMKLKAADPS